MHRFRPRIESRRLVPLLGLALFLIGLSGCQPKEPPSSYVARVGSHYLTQDDLQRMLSDMGPALDTTEARQQVIDQWITRTLLYREALRLNLESVDAVQRKLERQRRSILVTAVTNRIYEEADLAPSPEEVRTYFERHKDRFRLREPYVRVRYLATQRRSAAQTVRQALLERPVPPDSLWRRLVREHAADSARAGRLSKQVLPERRLSQQLPYSPDALAALGEGDVAPILEEDGTYHVLQLVRRLSEGTEPKLSWFENEIRRRLRIRARKQIYAREVERLRSKARTDGALESP